MEKDLISIVMPTYNDAPYLKSAIDDILAQTYENFELIIVDDGSTDYTSTILENYAKQDKRIQIFTKKNGGTGSALNLGFLKANGEFGTWASSDDNKVPHFLESLVTVMKDNRDIEFVSSAFESKYLGRIFKPYHQDPYSKKFTFCNGQSHDNSVSGDVVIRDDWCKINRIQCFLGTCFMFTMDLKKRCGDYINIPGEDYHMAMRMGLKSRYAYVDQVLGTHNDPPDSLSVENRNCVAEADKLTGEIYDASPKWHLGKIPKIANFYWGSNKMSFMRYMTIKSFKTHNPDWSVHLYLPKVLSESRTWGEDDNHHRYDRTDYTGELDYFDKLLEEVSVKTIYVDFSNSPLTNEASEVHKSDYLRWNILNKNGGLWCDMDIIFFKSLNNANFNIKNHSNVDTIMCYDPRHNSMPSIGFMMAEKNNILFKTYAKLSMNNFDPSKYQSIGSDMIINLYPTYELLASAFNNQIHNLDVDSVYYYDFKNLNNIYEINAFKELKEKGIGIHWYGGHPTSQKYNNLITHENYQDYDNTLCSAIKETLEKQ